MSPSEEQGFPENIEEVEKSSVRLQKVELDGLGDNSVRTDEDRLGEAIKTNDIGKRGKVWFTVFY
ncbi:hypothetical protein HZS_5769 [Henneguya salminicola]|nr:hypothetical protein HZS_5769 [Henneguya salminicola]